MILSLQRRLASGLTFFLGGYSWRKSTDIISSTAFEGNGVTHPYGQIGLDHSLSDFSYAGRFIGSFNYALPYAGGKSLYALYPRRLADERNRQPSDRQANQH